MRQYMVLMFMLYKLYCINWYFLFLNIFDTYFVSTVLLINLIVVEMYFSVLLKSQILIEYYYVSILSLYAFRVVHVECIIWYLDIKQQ